jgi:hypothetical protein
MHKHEDEQKQPQELNSIEFLRKLKKDAHREESKQKNEVLF